MKRLLFIPLVLVLVLGAVFVVRKRKAELARARAPEGAPLPVRVVAVRRGTLEVKRGYLGRVEPVVSVSVAPRVSGYLVEVRVREGDRVKKGDVLARIDAAEFLHRLKRVEALLGGAKSTLATLEGIYRRDLTLFKNEAISREKLDRSKSALDEARARVLSLEEELKIAKLELSYCTLRSPCNGVITRRLQNEGDLAVVGKPVLEMEVPERGYRVLVEVPQEVAVHLRVGSPVEIRPSLLDAKRRIVAKIGRVYPASGRGGLATVEVDLRNRPFGFPSGSTVSAFVVAERASGFILPAGALLRTGGSGVAFAVRGNRAVPVGVKVLADDGERVAVAGDLREGETVVVGGQGLLLRLRPGQRVEPVP